MGSSAPEGARLLEAVALMDRLRREGWWEAAQTHETLSGYLIEETYELLDAIAAGDRDELVAELGDVLLQVLFHARIGEGFTIDDVADSFIRKVSARSAGVLDGGVDIATQVDDWERAKAAERPGASAMEGIALGQPALALTAKILSRAHGAGIPDELIPPELTRITVTAEGGAEQALRAAALGFADRIRAAETELAGAGDGASGVGPSSRTRFTADEWRSVLKRHG
ncbi:MAG: MazG family protein [Tomitella sp.]|nr:MazG family protein [Tomitella sp.]